MSAIRLGIRENLPQFSLLVVVNALVGAMLGIKRSILPAIAEQEVHVAARTAVLSFIVVFTVTKALTNYLAGPQKRGLAMSLNEFTGHFAWLQARARPDGSPPATGSGRSPST